MSEQRRGATYWQSPTPDRCGVCRKLIHQGQWIRRLPDAYRPDRQHRHAHRRCIGELTASVEEQLWSATFRPGRKGTPRR
jgi:hypothetical protein